MVTATGAGTRRERTDRVALIDVDDVHFHYPRAALGPDDEGWTLKGISLEVNAGSTLGIVGESGSGKSTLIRVMCGLLRHQRGTVRFEGRPLGEFRGHDSNELRRKNQIVFQNPRRSLDPRMTIRRSVGEPIRALQGRKPDDDELVASLEKVGLGRHVLSRFPHQLSGGQLQRVGIARALSVDPTVLYADEPVSALDVSVQAQVLNLLMDLRDQLGLTLVMVSHDLGVVSRMCEEIIVMRHGRIVEGGRTEAVLTKPESGYTAALLEAARVVSLEREVIAPS
jgi:ABC-type glutathione transport system ATPase component